MSLEERAKMVMDQMVDKLPEVYNMEDIRGKVEEVTPYVMVAIQVGALDWHGCHCQHKQAAAAGCLLCGWRKSRQQVTAAGASNTCSWLMWGLVWCLLHCAGV